VAKSTQKLCVLLTVTKYLINSMEQSPSQTVVLSLRSSQSFMKPEGTLTYSQEPVLSHTNPVHTLFV